MKEWMEQGLGIAIIGGIIGAEVLARMVLFGYYIKLGNACKKIGTAKNKSLRYIKEGLKQQAIAGRDIKNAMVYTECRLAECRLFGIHVGAWEGVTEQSLLLVLLGSALCSLTAVMCNCAKDWSLNCLFFGGVGGILVVFLDIMTGMKARYRRIRLQIRNYIENSRWTEDAEISESDIVKAEVPDKKVRCCEPTGKKIKEKKVKKRQGKAQEEKRRLTEELLRDRRCLEAKRIAERMEREKENEPVSDKEHIFAQQEQAEAEAAAATAETETIQIAAVITSEQEKEEQPEMAYEVLLRNVLAEYVG